MPVNPVSKPKEPEIEAIYKDWDGIKWDVLRRTAVMSIGMIPAAGQILGLTLAVGCWWYRRADIQQDQALTEKQKEALRDAELKRLGGDIWVLVMSGIGGPLLASFSLASMTLKDVWKSTRSHHIGSPVDLKVGRFKFEKKFLDDAYSHGGLRVAEVNPVDGKPPEDFKISKDYSGAGWDVGRRLMITAAAAGVSAVVPGLGAAVACAIAYGCHKWRERDIKKDPKLTEQERDALLKEDKKRMYKDMSLGVLTGIVPGAALFVVAVTCVMSLYDSLKHSFKNLSGMVSDVGNADSIHIKGGMQVKRNVEGPAR